MDRLVLGYLSGAGLRFRSGLPSDRRIIFIIIIIIIIISFMNGIYTYIPETHNAPREYTVAAILLLLFMVPMSLVLALALLYFYVSTFRSMCAVPNMAVFCSSLTSWFPGIYYYYYYYYFAVFRLTDGFWDVSVRRPKGIAYCKDNLYWPHEFDRIGVGSSLL
jgi:magnesium-transporting ATPase (P-type)